MTAPSASAFLAFDFGSQSIGIAAGSPAGGLATPLSAVRVFRAGPDWAEIDKRVREWRPAGLVVGVALDSSGDDTPASRRARAFGARLAERYNLPVHWMNERLTTEAAREALRRTGGERSPRKQDVDNTAAALILDSFLDAQR